MTTTEMAKRAMKEAGLTQAETAERMGYTGQGSVSMLLQSKSMKTDSLVALLKVCGYELVAVSVDGKKPDLVLGDGNDRDVINRAGGEGLRDTVKGIVSDMVPEMVHDLVREELRKYFTFGREG